MMTLTTIGSLPNMEGECQNGNDQFIQITDMGTDLTEELVKAELVKHFYSDCRYPSGYFCKDFTVCIYPHWKHEAVAIVHHRYDI